MRNYFLLALLFLAVGCDDNDLTHTVGGTVTGLNGTLLLQNNSDDDLTITADGNFTFDSEIAEGEDYSVTVLTQPTGQECTVTDGSGTIVLDSVNNVTVTCVVVTKSVGGTVTGLSGTLVLQNNSGDNLTITADGNFTFDSEVPEGEDYSVTVLTQPFEQGCTVTNGSGTIVLDDISSVTVTCVDSLGSTTLIDVTPNPQVGIFTSYNSVADQFLLTWWDVDEDSINIMIYNPDGSIAVPYTQLFDATITPISEVKSCYNDHLNEYFVVWNEYTTTSGAFAILDAEGNVAQGLTAISGTHTPVSDVGCAYNSTDHQYFVTWTDIADGNYFAILNEDGTEELSETEIPNVALVTAGGDNLNATYNSAANEYFIAWAGSDFSVYYAIYDSNGAATKAATVITDSSGYSNIMSCYNSTNNEYFIPWYESGGVTYFSILDAEGDVVTGPQEISDFSSDSIYSPVTCSYNSLENNFLVTAVTPPLGLTDIIYTIVSDEGEIEVEPTTIPNPLGLLTHKAVYSSYSETSDTTFITWTADDSASVFNGYFVLYNFTP